MQRKEEISKVSRPSLISAAEQEQADRSRILSTLESGIAAPARTRATPRLAWVGMGAVALVLAIGAGAWILQERGDGQPVMADEGALAASAQQMTPQPAAPAHEASAAALIQDDHEAQQAPPPEESLQDMLERPEPASLGDGKVLSEALESPAGLVAGAAAGASAAAAPRARPKPAAAGKPAARGAVKPAKAAGPAASPEQAEAARAQENDVLLLSAVMAHATEDEPAPASAPAPTPKPKQAKPTLARQLAQCERLGKARAAQCRARVCAGRPNSGGCKVRR